MHHPNFLDEKLTAHLFLDLLGGVQPVLEDRRRTGNVVRTPVTRLTLMAMCVALMTASACA